MKKVRMLVGLLGVVACSSNNGSGTAPELSSFTMTSPVTAGSTTLQGTLDVNDPGGLAGISVTIELSGDGVSVSTTEQVPGGSTGETAATVPIELLLGSAPPAGNYTVTVTATEGGATSSPVSASVTIQ